MFIQTCQRTKSGKAVAEGKRNIGFIWVHVSPGAATVMQMSKWHRRKFLTWFRMKTDKIALCCWQSGLFLVVEAMLPDTN